MANIEHTNGKRPNFEKSVDTRLVYDRLKDVPVGETVSYTILKDILGRPVSGGSPVLQSALHSLQRDGIVFGNVRNVGYQRLKDEDIVRSSEADRKGIRRKARRAVEKLSSVTNFEALPNDLKIKHNAAVSGFGAIAAILAPAKMKQLESSVENAKAKLPLARTLEAFKG